MNHLELVQRLVYESGASGSSLAIATTVAQQGDRLNFVNWIGDAWLEIQGLNNWPSLWEEASVPVLASAATVVQGLPHKRYVKTGAKLTDSVTGQVYTLDYLPWHQFREVYTSVTAGAPGYWTIQPNRSLKFNATLANASTFTCERYAMPGKLVGDTAEPALFSEHHMMIVWRGLMLYAGFDEAGVAYKRGEAEYKKMKRLAGIDLPSMEPGEPLA